MGYEGAIGYDFAISLGAASVTMPKMLPRYDEARTWDPKTAKHDDVIIGTWVVTTRLLFARKSINTKEERRSITKIKYK